MPARAANARAWQLGRRDLGRGAPVSLDELTHSGVAPRKRFDPGRQVPARLRRRSRYSVPAYHLDIAADLVCMDEQDPLVGKRPVPPDGQAPLLPLARPFRVTGEGVEKIYERFGKTDGRVYGGAQMLELDLWQV